MPLVARLLWVVSRAIGLSEKNSFSATPSGVGILVGRSFRWYRCAQPPANFWDPSGSEASSNQSPMKSGRSRIDSVISGVGGAGTHILPINGGGGGVGSIHSMTVRNGSRSRSIRRSPTGSVPKIRQVTRTTIPMNANSTASQYGLRLRPSADSPGYHRPSVRRSSGRRGVLLSSTIRASAWARVICEKS